MKPEGRGEMPKKKIRILAVDDEIQDLNLMCNVLRAQDYTVFGAASYAEAIQTHRLHQGAIDLLVADVSLPDRNGCELASTLWEVEPGLRVLYISGATGTEVFKFSKVPIDDVQLLQKPFSSEVLLARVQAILEVGVPVRTMKAW